MTVTLLLFDVLPLVSTRFCSNHLHTFAAYTRVPLRTREHVDSPLAADCRVALEIKLHDVAVDRNVKLFQRY